MVLIAAVRIALADRADPVRAAQQQAYMKSAMPFRGVSTPEVRRLVDTVLADPAHALVTRDAWESAILELWDGAEFREERYAALAIARHRTNRHHRSIGALPLYRHLVTIGAWWDLVDEVATHLVRDELLADHDRVARVVVAWATDPDLWVRRTAILSQVGAGTRVDLDLLRSVIVPNLEHPTAGPDGRQGFFIRKAIGWSLRDAARHHPEWVGAFVAEHRACMAGLTQREASKYLGRRGTAEGTF